MNPNDVMKYGHFHFLRALENLPLSEWETGGVCGIWSVKNIVCHIASYEVFMDEMLVKILGDTQPTRMHDALSAQGPEAYFAAFNDVEVNQRQAYTAQQAIDEYLAAYERVAAKGLLVNADTWRKNGTIGWYGDAYSLEDYVVYAQYGHKREHLAEINVYKTNLTRH